MSVEKAVRLLVDCADHVGLPDLERLAAVVLEDNSPTEIKAIASGLPETLRSLLPNRTLH